MIVFVIMIVGPRLLAKDRQAGSHTERNAFQCLAASEIILHILFV